MTFHVFNEKAPPENLPPHNAKECIDISGETFCLFFM